MPTVEIVRAYYALPLPVRLWLEVGAYVRGIPLATVIAEYCEDEVAAELAPSAADLC